MYLPGCPLYGCRTNRVSSADRAGYGMAIEFLVVVVKRQSVLKQFTRILQDMDVVTVSSMHLHYHMA